MLRYAVRVPTQLCLRSMTSAAACRLTSPALRPNNLLVNCSASSHAIIPTRDLHLNAQHCAAEQAFTKKTVRERILLVLSLYDKINPDQLTMESDFFKDLGLDSLDFVEVIVMIEDEFLFEIPGGDSDRFKCPQDIYQYICDKEDVYE